VKSGIEFRWKYNTESHMVCVRVRKDAALPDVFEAFKCFALACGYSEETVQKCLGEPIMDMERDPK
jgi:hypothetical protein